MLEASFLWLLWKRQKNKEVQVHICTKYVCGTTHNPPTPGLAGPLISLCSVLGSFQVSAQILPRAWSALPYLPEHLITCQLCRETSHLAALPEWLAA